MYNIDLLLVVVCRYLRQMTAHAWVRTRVGRVCAHDKRALFELSDRKCVCVCVLWNLHTERVVSTLRAYVLFGACSIQLGFQNERVIYIWLEDGWREDCPWCELLVGGSLVRSSVLSTPN